MRKKLTAILALAAMTQVGCYNSYFIDTTELEKLESSVEPQDVVTVYGDCPRGTTAASITELGPLYAQNDTPPEETPPAEGTVDDDVMSEIEAITGDAEATDAADGTAKQGAPAEQGTKGDGVAAPAPAGRAGCTEVQVSTQNALKLVTVDGTENVTPFNFIMSGGQLVSPEYNLLRDLEEVEGARVREFSTFKTVSTIVLVSAVAIGTFVGISFLAPDAGGFAP